MPYYLYIDTSGAHSFSLIMNDERVLVTRSNTETMNHAAFINVHIQEMLEHLSITMNDLKAVCVLNGPGSYTGLRISLSVAKGICYAIDIPLILLNRLDVMQVSSICNESCFTLMKARENEYFMGSYSKSGELIGPYQLLSKEEVESSLQSHHAKLIIDSILLSEFPNATVVHIDEKGIFSSCLKKIECLEHADLLSSEPFYLKNVHINKINKL